MDISTYDNFRYDYDCFDSIGIYTENFTENMDIIEILTRNHKFYIYLSGFLHFENMDYILDKIYHAYYLKEYNKLKMCVSSNLDNNILTAIYYAWQYFWKCENKDLDVYIYYTYCGSLHLSNNYEIDEKHLYKWLINKCVDKI
jgi:hypothetical protein